MVPATLAPVADVFNAIVRQYPQFVFHTDAISLDFLTCTFTDNDAYVPVKFRKYSH